MKTDGMCSLIKALVNKNLDDHIRETLSKKPEQEAFMCLDREESEQLAKYCTENDLKQILSVYRFYWIYIFLEAFKAVHSQDIPNIRRTIGLLSLLKQDHLKGKDYDPYEYDYDCSICHYFDEYDEECPHCNTTTYFKRYIPIKQKYGLNGNYGVRCTIDKFFFVLNEFLKNDDELFIELFLKLDGTILFPSLAKSIVNWNDLQLVKKLPMDVLKKYASRYGTEDLDRIRYFDNCIEGYQILEDAYHEYCAYPKVMEYIYLKWDSKKSKKKFLHSEEKFYEFSRMGLFDIARDIYNKYRNNNWTLDIDMKSNELDDVIIDHFMKKPPSSFSREEFDKLFTSKGINSDNKCAKLYLQKLLIKEERRLRRLERRLKTQNDRINELVQLQKNFS